MEVSQKSTTPNTAHTIRLIATDLDGTLLRPDGSISSRTIAALQRVREAGMLVVLVSGRPPRVMRQVAQTSGIGGLAICCNGAILYDLDGDCVLQCTSLLPAQTEWIIKTLHAAISNLHFAVEDGLAITCEPGYADCYPESKQRKWRIADTSVCYSSPIVKLIARHSEYALEELHTRVLSLLGAAYSVTYSNDLFLEIAMASVNKASALAQFCAQQGVDTREVIAFGDMPNDLSMLQWAGRGIAVANAHSLVLEAVSEITRSNAEDGVALVLEQLLARFPDGEPTAVQTTRQHPTS